MSAARTPAREPAQWFTEPRCCHHCSRASQASGVGPAPGRLSPEGLGHGRPREDFVLWGWQSSWRWLSFLGLMRRLGHGRSHLMTFER